LIFVKKYLIREYLKCHQNSYKVTGNENTLDVDIETNSGEKKIALPVLPARTPVSNSVVPDEMDYRRMKCEIPATCLDHC